MIPGLPLRLHLQWNTNWAHLFFFFSLCSVKGLLFSLVVSFVVFIFLVKAILASSKVSNDLYWAPEFRRGSLAKLPKTINP